MAINREAFSESPDHDTQRRERIARAWRYNETLEQMAALAERDPDRFERIYGGGAARISIGMYVEQRAAAKAAGIDVSGGAA